MCLQAVWNAVGGLKNVLESVVLQLEEMRRRKIERKNKIFEVMDQLEKISNDLSGSIEDGLYKMVVDETDLSLKRLEELRALLLDYQNDKVLAFCFLNKLEQVLIMFQLGI